MKTFGEIELDIMRVREAINDLNIKGEHNASLIVYASGKCSEMIDAIHEIVNQNAKNQNGKYVEEVKKDGNE